MTVWDDDSDSVIIIIVIIIIITFTTYYNILIAMPITHAQQGRGDRQYRWIGKMVRERVDTYLVPT